MKRTLSIGLAVLLAIGVGAAIFSSVSKQRTPKHAAPLTQVKGIIGSEKEPLFHDPQVTAVFARHGLRVQVDTAGSREIATRINLKAYDFAFPAGIPAADKIRHDSKAAAVYQPFFTPMAIATFKPIAELLGRAKVASPFGNGYYRFDMKTFLDLVARNTRWTDLPGNQTYPARKSILISSTDVRTSNSAAMYLSIASYVANGDNIVQGQADGNKVLAKVAPLFLRQGYEESSSEGPFGDYLTIGIGKVPMVMIYEAQFLAAEAAHRTSGDMVLMYPSPTVLSKHTLVPLDPNGDRVGRLLATDPELQQLAVRYGFRTADAATFSRYLAQQRVAAPPALVDVIEPPTYENLEYLIGRIEQRLQGA
jgi:hypothetical protein